MKNYFKKYWLLIVIAIIINVPILILCCVRTDKSLTLKGDTTVIEKFVEVDRKYIEEGSFSSIYVISFDHSTLFQNLILKNSNVNDTEDMYEGYLHLSNSEINQMGKIQHESSINYALICAYTKAKEVNTEIVFDYEFDYFQIAYYAQDSEFRIGDKIYGVNDVYASEDFESFKDLFNSAASSKDGNSEYIVQRNGKIIRIKNTEANLKISGYSFYKIAEEVFPTYTLKSTNVGGPSGGLLQTLSIYNSLVDEDITRGLKITGTGTIEGNGTVGAIGGIKQKIFTANDDNMDVFLCPEANYEEALEAYNTLKNPNMKLFMVRNLDEALEVLKNA